MINEVLDLTRVESGRVPVGSGPLQLPKLIGGCRRIQITGRSHKSQFCSGIEGVLPEWVQADPVRLRQVLYNLLGKAMKFTAIGEVAFRVYADSTRIRFEVKDTGKGIPKQELSSIFKPFYQPVIEEELFEILGKHLELKWI